MQRKLVMLRNSKNEEAREGGETDRHWEKRETEKQRNRENKRNKKI